MGFEERAERRGWAGGLPATLGNGDVLAVTACGSVLDPEHPREAVPSRYAATRAVPEIRDDRQLAGLISSLVSCDPADATYGLTFVADFDPLTTRLRTLTGTAMSEFLRHPLTGPGRWLFTAPDHGRWVVTRPWSMDTAFTGCSVVAACQLDHRTTSAVPTPGGAHELVG